MNLLIPSAYLKQPIARRSRRLYDQMREGDKSHVRRLAHIPIARVINVGRQYRILSLDRGTNWQLLPHDEYERVIKKWHKKKR
ncbi:ParE family toxin-like protein [Salmonella enterica]|uniref:ParE family toxin-like protein n=1 Tax=Salmonella enterica TaxID=28901 RepID=UPI0009AA2149